MNCSACRGRNWMGWGGVDWLGGRRGEWWGEVGCEGRERAGMRFRCLVKR